jgi:hypothetical protein
VEPGAFQVGTPALLVAEQQFNLPVAAAVLVVKTALETVLLVDQAAAADLLVVEQQAAALRHRVGKVVLVAVLRLALFLAAVVVLMRLERRERLPLLVAAGTATLIQ